MAARPRAAVVLALGCASPVLAQTAPGGEPPPQASPTAAGAAGAAELAKKLSNPVASLTSAPSSSTGTRGIGLDEDGRRFLMDFQPVMPSRLNDDWNLIARVIVPVLAQPVLVEGGRPSSGTGDFFSPSRGGLLGQGHPPPPLRDEGPAPLAAASGDGRSRIGISRPGLSRAGSVWV